MTDEPGLTEEIAAETNWRKTPHRYVRPATPGWRTCTLCGIGANAEIHRGTK